MTTISRTASRASAKDYELEMLRTAAILDAMNPLWLVVFSVYYRRFMAFPKFNVPIGTIATSENAAALEERMRWIELAAGVANQPRGGISWGKRTS
ncbi:MAG: hypothetical protein J2P25_01410 [Nocardiopsaceae bacterium]|nr:hypothetical protein [Nocardiopsaceae bacterium]